MKNCARNTTHNKSFVWDAPPAHSPNVKQMTVIGTKETNIKIDWLSTLLVTLLIATLLAFFIGYFPYPYGWIIITIALIAKLTANSGKNDS